MENKKMRVLVACEFSGTVRDAFAKLGHDAWSCDLLPSLTPGNHIKGDAIEALNFKEWDLLIAHPPCTYLTVMGERWFYHNADKHLPTSERRPHPSFPNRRRDRELAVDFFMQFINSKIPFVAVENPIGLMSTRFRKPDQIIQPWQFGHDASKATCLWLKGLKKLTPTKIVEVTKRTTSTGKVFSSWYWETSRKKGQERQMERSKTFQGIADAMAEQWGNLKN